MNASDFDTVIDVYHQAAHEFVKGNPEPYKRLFSQREDVTLGNPFGPVQRGWQRVAATMERAAALFREGEWISFENVSKFVTPGLAYIVEVERFRVKIGGSRDMSMVALRTTSILRPEEGTCKIVHRQADTITSDQRPDSIAQK
jgi:ketosteroid isomerase-like protein